MTKKFDAMLKQLLTEANIKTRSTISGTSEDRHERASNVKVLSLKRYTHTRQPPNRFIRKGYRNVAFVARSAELTEGKDHQGYIELNSHNSITDCFCSCRDFGYRWRKVLADHGMADFDIEPEFNEAGSPDPHTQELPYETNPLMKKAFCKHILKVIDKTGLVI